MRTLDRGRVLSSGCHTASPGEHEKQCLGPGSAPARLCGGLGVGWGLGSPVSERLPGSFDCAQVVEECQSRRSWTPHPFPTLRLNLKHGVSFENNCYKVFCLLILAGPCFLGGERSAYVQSRVLKDACSVAGISHLRTLH